MTDRKSQGQHWVKPPNLYKRSFYPWHTVYLYEILQHSFLYTQTLLGQRLLLLSEIQTLLPRYTHYQYKVPYSYLLHTMTLLFL